MNAKRGKRQAREANEEIAILNAKIAMLEDDILGYNMGIEQLQKELAESKQPKRATKK